jgi:hypothetical protein
MYVPGFFVCPRYNITAPQSVTYTQKPFETTVTSLLAPACAVVAVWDEMPSA